jgi:hypothetical protein
MSRVVSRFFKVSGCFVPLRAGEEPEPVIRAG